MNIQYRCSVTRRLQQAVTNDQPALFNRLSIRSFLLYPGFYESAPLQWLTLVGWWANSFPSKTASTGWPFSNDIQRIEINYTQWWVRRVALQFFCHPLVVPLISTIPVPLHGPLLSCCYYSSCAIKTALHWTCKSLSVVIFLADQRHGLCFYRIAITDGLELQCTMQCERAMQWQTPI